jgi:hypothetical protein
MMWEGIGGACRTHEGLEIQHFSQPELKIPPCRHRCRQEDNTEMEIQCEGVDWIQLAQDRDQ